MSEQVPENNNDPSTPDPRGDYSSQVDPAFSRAWNETFAEEDPTKAQENSTEAPPAGEGEAAPATSVEPSGQQPAAAAPAAGGENPPAAASSEEPGKLPGTEGADAGAAKT